MPPAMTGTSEEESRSSRGNRDVVASFISLSFAFLILTLRILTRASIVRNVGAEDYVIVVSFMFSVVLSVLIYIEFQHGQGHHIATISVEDQVALLKALWASVPVYQLSLTLTKISILLQYWRVFVSTSIRRLIIALFAVTVVYGMWSVFGTLFMCVPVSYFWKGAIAGGHCLNRYSVWFANASLNIVTDIAIFVLPMPVLHDLHLPRRQRFALMAVFGLGAFVCLTSILRLKALYAISVSTDVTWDNGGAAEWSSLEVNVGIICASLPTLRKTISRFFPKFLSESPASEARDNMANRVSRRGSRRESGLKRFFINQETSEWAQTLPFPDGYGKSSTKVGLNSKIERGSRDDDSVDDVEEGIKVVTVTTQQVQIATPKPVASPRDLWDNNKRDYFEMQSRP